MRQPSLFNFKPIEQLRRSGFTPEQERELIGFCLSDDYPRTITVGPTTYTLKSEHAARSLLKALRFGTKTTREQMTFRNQLSLR